MWNYAFTVPQGKRIRYIIDADCAAEVDDQYTVAHALMTPKLDVKGIIAAHFDRINLHGYAKGETAAASYAEVEKILDLMHLTGQYPVCMGAPTCLPDEHTPIDSEGARLIIEEAMREDDRPLFIGVQGAITDLASAILMEPRICDRMTAIWIGGGDYPDGGPEFNLEQDIHAANVVFKSQMPLWQVPVSTYKQFGVSLAELQHKVRPHGKIGAYLFENLAALNRRMDDAHWPWPHGELWGLGDEGTIAALMEEQEKLGSYELRPAPVVDPETLRYLPGQPGRTVRVYHTMNARLDLEDLFCKLAINFPNQDD